MSSHRVPLANNPNAANSPYRATNASKRARAASHDIENECSPPKKRQLLSKDIGSFRRAQKISLNEPEGKVFAERRDHGVQNLFQRKLLAAGQGRQRINAQADGKQEQTQPGQEQESLQNWRKHYRRVFPYFVIYFDSIPSDTVLRFKRMVLKLGGRQADFFSKDVTHVITTRSIPSSSQPAGVPRDNKATIDPLMLSKGPDKQISRTLPRSGQALHDLSFKASTDPKQSLNTNDILHKAQNLGIKIWTSEKFDRILTVIFSEDSIEDDEEGPVRGGTILASKGVPPKRQRENDLSQLLKNERKNAPVERKPWQEIVPFKGPFIYIHHMDESVKPIMIREYTAPARKGEGDWPMLRSVSKGRCPFIEEPPPQQPVETRRTAVKGDQATRAAPRLTRAHTAPNPGEQEDRRRTRSQTRSPQKPPLADVQPNKIIKPSLPTAKSFEPPQMGRPTSGSTENMPPMLGSTHANFKGLSRNPGGEPTASGMRKDVTSAIQSQMYSSTAPSAPGRRVGTTKQQHEMSRRVLERQSGLSGTSVPSSHNVVSELRAAINNDPPPAPRRSTRQKAAEPLMEIHEDEEDEAEAKVQRQRSAAVKQKKPIRRDPKPGYCENCRDKYDDFQEHITSKKHRKFATTDEHWTELDSLLKKLIRI